MKKLIRYTSTLIVLLFSTSLSFSQCAVIYVSPTGTAIGDGTEASPMDIQTGFAQACIQNRKHVRVLAGTYTLTSKLTIGCNDLIIDGDWEISGGVGRKNSSLVTTININSLLETGPYDGISGTTVGYYIGIEAISRVNFRIEDITFNVKNGGLSGTATGTTGNRGNSVYGFYFRSSTSWVLERCNMNTGSGSQGASGTNGVTSLNGSNGTVAAYGDCDDDAVPSTGGNGGAGAGPVSGAVATYTSGSNDGGINGGSGSSTAIQRNGGGGGAGGSGGHEERNGGLGGSGGSNTVGGGAGGTGAGAAGSSYGSNGCNSTASDGKAGNPGANGANGTTGAVLAVSTTYDLFWVPSGQSATGNNGYGGGGGQGGGGGGGQGCFFCVDGTGGGGGGGGGGGQGGQAGTGGCGSGGTFAFYQFGGSGTRNNTVLVSGAAAVGGVAGIGANGGTGGTGGTGGGGNNISTSGSSITAGRSCGSCIEVGAGGRGGAGGSGGRGGDGGAGAAGASIVAQLVGGATAPSNSIAGISQVITNRPLEGCTNSEILITKDGGTWTLTGSGTYIQDLTASTSSYGNSSASALVSYSTTGSQPITINGTDYNGFIQINTSRPLPTFGSGMSSVICEGTNFSMSTATVGAEYEWVVFGAATNSLTPTAVFTTQVASWTTPVTGLTANYKVRLRVRTACCGWSAPVYYDFSVQPPTAAPVSSGITICSGSTATITATGTGIGNLTWYSDALAQIVLQSTPGSSSSYTTGVLTQNTTYFVAETGGSCGANLTSVQIIVSANPGAANNTTSTASICEGDTKALAATPSGGTWSVVSGGGTISGTTYTSPAIVANTNVTVDYIIPAVGVCPASSSSVTFTVNDNVAIPVISTSTAAICEGGTKVLAATPTGGTWNVVSGGGTIAGATYSSPVLSANTNVTVSYTLAANGACPGTSSNLIFDIDDNVGIASNTTSVADICENDSKTLVGSPSGGTWSIVSGGGSISGTTYTNTPISSNTPVTIQYAIAANGACPATTSDAVFTVYDNVGPVAITTLSTPICAGETTSLAATPTGGAWTIASGSGTISGTDYVSNSGLLTAETVTLTYTLTNGACSSSNNLSFSVNPIPGVPDITLVTADTICSGQNTTITATNAGSGTLAWFTSNVPSGSPLNVGSTFNVSPTTTTTYYVFGNAAGACFSPVYDSTIIVVNSPSVVPVNITASSTSVCSGETLTLTVNGGSLAVGADWFWYSGSCGTNSVGQGNSITVAPTTNTTYFVRAEGGTCAPSACVNITITIQNTVSASYAIPSLICVNTTSVNLNQYLSPSATTGGTWSGVALTSGSVFNPSTLGVGTFTVKYKVGTFPCVDSVSQTFSIVSPSASLSALNDSYVILESQSGLFNVTTNDLPSTLMISSIGSPANGTASIVGNQISYTSNTDFRGLDSMSYSICDSICVSSCSNAIVYIQVDSDVIDGGNGSDGNGNVGGWILTPNGDGKDDVFYIDGLYGYQKNEIVIFNRWGDEIYSASPYKNDWTATSPKDVVSGTYFFILKLTLMDNTEKVVKGFIHVEK